MELRIWGPRPSARHSLAILFPDDETTPEFVWIETAPDDEEPGDDYQRAGARVDNKKPTSARPEPHRDAGVPVCDSTGPFSSLKLDGLLGDSTYPYRWAEIAVGARGGGDDEQPDHSIRMVYVDDDDDDASDLPPNRSARYFADVLLDECIVRVCRGPVLLVGVRKMLRAWQVCDLGPEDFAVVIKGLLVYMTVE